MTNDIVMFATYVRPWSWSRIWVLVTLAELIHAFHSDGGLFALAGAMEDLYNRMVTPTQVGVHVGVPARSDREPKEVPGSLASCHPGFSGLDPL